jgi:uncharacterized protein YkwD
VKRNLISMVKDNDGPYAAWLQAFRHCFPAILAALLAAACTGPASPIAPPDLTRRWPPDEPRQAARLTTPLPPGADPLVWWESTFFDTLPQSVYADSYSAKVAVALIKETNERRADNGLAAVSEDHLLSRVAQAHAFDEATRDYWNHRNPEGMGSRDRVLAASGIAVTSGGENSAVANSLDNRTAAVVVHSFEHHAGHRELLLSTEVQRIGVGIYQYGPQEQVHIIQLLMTY